MNKYGFLYREKLLQIAYLLSTMLIIIVIINNDKLNPIINLLIYF